MTRTTRTESLQIDSLEPSWVVDGAFGLSGVYPLQDDRWHDGLGHWVRTCNMWFVRVGVSEATRLRHPVVVEKTHYRLWQDGQTRTNEEICSLCLNGSCPANRNPASENGEWGAGVLVLATPRARDVAEPGEA